MSRGFDASKAAIIIDQRARETPEFKQGFAAAQAIAVETVQKVNEMDELDSFRYLKHAGGWTKIITDAFYAVVGDATIPGSFNTTYPIRAALTSYDVQGIRLAAVRDLR